MKVIIQWTYFSKKTGSASFRSDLLEPEAAIAIVEDLEKSGRLKDIEFEDQLGSTWTKKELLKLLAEVEDEPQNVTVFFDGGYRKEEEISGLGIVIYFQQNKQNWRIRKNLLLEQLESNNEAEYAAIYNAIQLLEEMGVHHQTCVFKGDSLVVLNQLSGEWACYEKPLNQWMDRIEAKLAKLKLQPEYVPILRKDNQEADKLASQAINGEEIYSKLPLAKKE